MVAGRTFTAYSSSCAPDFVSCPFSAREGSLSSWRIETFDFCRGKDFPAVGSSDGFTEQVSELRSTLPDSRLLVIRCEDPAYSTEPGLYTSGLFWAQGVDTTVAYLGDFESCPCSAREGLSEFLKWVPMQGRLDITKDLTSGQGEGCLDTVSHTSLFLTCLQVCADRACCHTC